MADPLAIMLSHGWNRIESSVIDATDSGSAGSKVYAIPYDTKIIVFQWVLTVTGATGSTIDNYIQGSYRGPETGFFDFIHTVQGANTTLTRVYVINNYSTAAATTGSTPDVAGLAANTVKQTLAIPPHIRVWRVATIGGTDSYQNDIYMFTKP